MSDQNSVQWESVGEEEAAKVANIIRLHEVGQTITGKYTGTVEVKGGQYGDETHYAFIGRGADGNPAPFTINPPADLRRRYSVLKVGQIVKTTRLDDKPPLVEGNKPAHQFKVEVAKQGSAPAAPAPKDPALDFLG